MFLCCFSIFGNSAASVAAVFTLPSPPLPSRCSISHRSCHCADVYNQSRAWIFNPRSTSREGASSLKRRARRISAARDRKHVASRFPRFVHRDSERGNMVLIDALLRRVEWSLDGRTRGRKRRNSMVLSSKFFRVNVERDSLNRNWDET